jgi:glycerol-3-phosphate dehydrogenase
MKQYDVAIIGAGVTGAAVARQLSRYKLKIVLIEKEEDVSFGTSKANSGIIHAGFHSAPGLLKTRLCLKGNRLFDRLKEELGFAFERRGELVVAFDEAEMETLRALYAQGLRNGVPYLEFAGRERVFNPDVQGALHAPTAGIIEPYEYCFALVENALANGVELWPGEKVEIIRTQVSGPRNGRFLLETGGGLKLKAEYVVNAAGLFADEVAACLGSAGFAIAPRKGEEYLLDRRVGNLVRRIIFPVPSQTSKGLLIIPTVDGTVMIGPTAEDVKDKTDFATTREGLRRVFESAQRLVPAIRANDVITSFAGLRPVAVAVPGPVSAAAAADSAGLPGADDFIIGSGAVARAHLLARHRRIRRITPLPGRAFLGAETGLQSDT